MGKEIGIIPMLCTIVLIALPVVHGNGPKEMKNWFRKAPHMDQKVTNLHFYLHDILSGPNPTNIPIAMPNFNAGSPTYFGLIAAIDDPLTLGPNPDSEILGRAQGVFGSTSLEELAYHMTFNLVFTNGEYSGSTLSVIGRNPFLNEYRELAIVGGSGVFRLARGIARLNTVIFNKTTGDAVVEYNIMVLHY